MSLASLYNIPQTRDQLAVWSFSNAAAHLDIIRVLQQKTPGAQFTAYVLDPMDPEDPASMEQWLTQHQVMHTEMDAALGIQGFDLSEVNWQDQGQLAGWIQSHASEHLQAGQILNLG